MRKVMTVVGTRPELIKLSRVIHELDRHVEHVLVHTGQNFDFELSQVFFDELGIRKPDEFLEAAGQTAMATIAAVLAKGDVVLEKHGPDALVLLGDTNSCLIAIAAKRRKIPIFHLEAGNRCFDMRVPEEINRRIVDHLSDINLVYTEHARRYLLAEGLDADLVIKTGSPMREVLSYHAQGIESSKVHQQLGLERRGYIVVSAHREENVDRPERVTELVRALNAMAERFDKEVVFSVHPRTRQRLEARSDLVLGPRVRSMRPLGFLSYARLQRDAFCVVSDSGTVTEESALLGFPAVTIRQAHERPEGMDVGILVMADMDVGRILEAMAVVTTHAFQDGVRFGPVADYGNEQVSRQVLRLLLSYTDLVNRRTWSKPGS